MGKRGLITWEPVKSRVPYGLIFSPLFSQHCENDLVAASKSSVLLFTGGIRILKPIY